MGSCTAWQFWRNHLILIAVEPVVNNANWAILDKPLHKAANTIVVVTAGRNLASRGHCEEFAKWGKKGVQHAGHGSHVSMQSRAWGWVEQGCGARQQGSVHAIMQSKAATNAQT